MVAKRSRKARAGAEPAGFDPSTFLHFHARVADGEANGLQSRDSRFESVPWCHRRARQMVSPPRRPRSPTGRGNRLKIGEVWVRIPAGPPTCRAWCNLRAPTTACYYERAESASDDIFAHSIPKRFKYLRRRSASFVVALRPRDALNSNRPASESDLHCRHTSMT